MKKLITALTATFFAVTGALAAKITVGTQLGTLTGDAPSYTATNLVYKTADQASSGCNRTEEGWYAGIKLNWSTASSDRQKAADTKAKVEDGGKLNSKDEYSVFYLVNLTPSGCGMKNDFQRSGVTSYMKTTEWYIYVTPEFMYSLDGADYSATLTIGGNTYTITVPQTVELFDNDGVKWYPAIAVVDGKVYGNMERAVEAATLAACNEKDMAFFVEPEGYPENASVVEVDEGKVWKLVINEPIAIDDAVVTLSVTESVVRNANIDVEINDVTLGIATLVKDVDYTIDASSVMTAKEVGEYTVTINGIGNYSGFASATWKIIEPTGTFATDAMCIKKDDPAYGEISSDMPRRLIITNTTALVYKNDERSERWEAAVDIRWPHEETSFGTYIVQLPTSVQYTDASHAAASIGTEIVAYGNEILAGELDWLSATTSKATYYKMNGYAPPTSIEYEYFDTLTWTVPIRINDINAAIESGAEHVEFSMVFGSVAWGNSTEGDTDGVAFQDYTITIPIDDNLKLYDQYENQVYPAVAYIAQIDGGKKYLSLADALAASESDQTIELIAQDDYEGEYNIPAGVIVALGEFGSAGAMYVLSKESVLISAAECFVSTREIGYKVDMSSENPYTYNVVMQHVHNWKVDKNGSELTATCMDEESCPLITKTYSMRLFTGENIDATEDVSYKPYDGASMSRKAVYGEGFTNVFPNVSTTITAERNGNLLENAQINDVGEYTVTMTVTGVGNDEQKEYKLVKNVTISQLDIAGATVTFVPSSIMYDGKEHSVTCTAKKNGLDVTFDIAEGSVTNATAYGKYTVTLNATGDNFTGSVDAEWEILNMSGEPTSVEAIVEGSMEKRGNDFKLSDSSKLEYDAEEGVWYAGITITWPLETSSLPLRYVKSDTVQLTVDGKAYTGKQIINNEAIYDNGKLEAHEDSKTFFYIYTIKYLETATWKVRITPEIIEAALAKNETELVYVMNAGAFAWNGTAQGDPEGVEFQNYTITISIDDNLKLYDGDGKQVYPKAEGQTIIEDIKDEIDTEVTEEVAESAKGKIDDLVNNVVAGESPEQDVADWVSEMKNGYDTPADFYTALAESDYVEASFKLGTDELITEESEVEVAEFEETEDGFAFAVTIDGDDIEAARVKAAEIIKTSTDLKSFSALDKDRVEVSGDGKMTVKKGSETSCEFFMVEIQKDKVE